MKHKGLRDLVKNRYIYLMTLPALLFSLIFSYLPLAGITMAFQDFNPIKGIFGSEFIGLRNFEFFFRGRDWFTVTFNTVFLNLLFIGFGTLLSITLAIMLSELGKSLFVRGMQSIMILPNFISWPIVGLFSVAFLTADTGTLDGLMKGLGISDAYMESSIWPVILLFFSLWKGAGFGAIVYLAAIAGIDRGLYEAAKIDGASRLQCIFRITLPMLKSTIIMLFLLALGGIFSGTLDMVYSLVGDNSFLFPTTDTIDTYVFRALRTQGSFGMSQAVALYQSIIGFILVVLSNQLVKKFDKDSSIF
ncbi:sugar ABC transporter permease [Paenibacillus sp. MY03]|uniref:ABC transporter permease n=1 Tax=Paenibacillus sp. MY03 TaxID=302980 RepID=UPI00211ADC85|nr:ABC transporter permease subunit [Paenibacillus sp. MY03]